MRPLAHKVDGRTVLPGNRNGISLCAAVRSPHARAFTDAKKRDDGGAPLSIADLVVVDANVITVNTSQPRAQAFAIAHGRILAVGSDARIRKLIGPATRVLDLHGKTVTPGFIDCHMHPSALYPEDAPYASVPLDPSHVHSMAELIAVLHRHSLLVPKGYWIRGTRYDDAKLGRHPTRFDLDQASTDHPISISHVSGHISVVNSLALANAGITKDTPDPAGGAYDRSPDGTPNGVCRESAGVGSGGAPSLKPDHDARIAGLQRCFEKFLAKGITSASDAAASPEGLRNYQDLQAAGCPVRINVMLMYNYLSNLQNLGLKGPFGSERLRVGTIKFFHGNSFSGRTCWVSKPYAGRPDYFGIPPATSQQELNEVILNIHRAGFQVAVHSNGDREISMVLTAFENAQKQFPRKDPRFRIEHCSVCTPEILARAKAVGAVLVFHSYMWENGDKLKDYGEDRYDWLAPMARARAMGIHVTSHSDYSVSAADPLLRIQDLVTRRTEAGDVIGASQCISVEEAIRVWTLDAAYATFEENVKGSLVPGKLADFVILGADPTRTNPLAIRMIPVEQTYIDGRCVWTQTAHPAHGAAQGEDSDD
jgi:predicted amidohydrolase YtcJ